jgi:uncharacterized membrane protein
VEAATENAAAPLGGPIKNLLCTNSRNQAYSQQLRIRINGNLDGGRQDLLTKLLVLWERVRSSLWALPLLMIVGAVTAAIVAMRADIPDSSDIVWFLYSGRAKTAPDFLSDLVTSMITMATLVISITMVVLTLSAQQLGPRLIRSFMADRRTQATLGLFIGTVVYLLLVLRTAYGSPDEVSNLAVTGGTALVLISVIALPIFVHHLARSIIADNVIQRVGNMLDGETARLLPAEEDPENLKPVPRLTPESKSIAIARSGYVDAIDYKSLVTPACEEDAVINLVVRAGDHVLEGMTVAEISPPSAAGKRIRDSISKCIGVSHSRNAVQDAEYYVRQLVEIAVRAQSTGVNDPFTAIAALDRLTASLARIMRRGPAKRIWCDGGGRVRVVADVSSFEGFVELAFQQIREQAKRDPAVLIRTAENLAKLHALARPDRRDPLIAQARLLLQAGETNIELKDDFADLAERLVPVLGPSPLRRASPSSPVAGPL